MLYIYCDIFKLNHLITALILTSIATTSFAKIDDISNNSHIENAKLSNTSDKNLPIAYFDKIVITATKTNKKLADTPIPVTLITQQQLQQNHARTLKQALELLPNVYLRPIHGKTGYEVIMQGFSGDQVLILIDGLPITASTGSTVNLNQYLNIDVEQIEVIQGASSAQYGSSAMGGVINVITKRMQSQEAPITGSMTAEVASNGEQNPSNHTVDDNRQFLETSIDARLDKQGHWLARLSGSYLNDNGLTVNPQGWAKIKDSSEQSQVTGKLLYQPQVNDDNQQFWLEATTYQEEDQSRFNYTVAQRILPQQRDESIDKQRVSIGLNYLIDSNSLLSDAKLNASLLYENYKSNSNTYSLEQINNPYLETNRHTKIDTHFAQAQLDLPSWKSSDKHTHLIQIGTQAQQDKLAQTKNGISELQNTHVKRDVAEFYIQDDWLIGKNWEIVSGIRYQYDSDFGQHIAPKIAVKYNHVAKNGVQHIWRASVGQGYRVPNLKERYYVFDHSNLGYKVMGNPSLQPETSNSYQFGYHGQLSKNFIVTANAFYNDVKNLIQTDENNAIYDGNIAIYYYTNAKEATTYGGDIGLTWYLFDDYQLQANYTHTHTHNKQTNTELVSRPKHKMMLSLNQYLTDKLQLIYRLNYESKHLVSSASGMYSPSWWTFDSKLNYQATPFLTLYTAINNLFDVQRNPVVANDQRPIDNRQWLFGLNYSF